MSVDVVVVAVEAKTLEISSVENNIYDTIRNYLKTFLCNDWLSVCPLSLPGCIDK